MQMRPFAFQCALHIYCLVRFRIKMSLTIFVYFQLLSLLFEDLFKRFNGEVNVKQK